MVGDPDRCRMDEGPGESYVENMPVEWEAKAQITCQEWSAWNNIGVL